MAQEEVVPIRLRRTTTSTPWGFRMQGGNEYGTVLFVQRVNPKSLSYRQGLRLNDRLLAIGNVQVHGMTHEQAKMEIIRAGNELDLIVQRKPGQDQPDSHPVRRGAPEKSSQLVEESTEYRGYTNPNVQSRSFKILQDSLSYSESHEAGTGAPSGQTPGEGVVRRAYTEGRRRLEELRELNPRNFTEEGESPYRYNSPRVEEDDQARFGEVQPVVAKQYDPVHSVQKTHSGQNQAPAPAPKPQPNNPINIAASSVLSPAGTQQEYLSQAYQHYQQQQPDKPLKLVNYQFDQQYGHLNQSSLQSQQQPSQYQTVQQQQITQTHQAPQQRQQQNNKIQPHRPPQQVHIQQRQPQGVQAQISDFIPATKTVSSVAEDLDLKHMTDEPKPHYAPVVAPGPPASQQPQQPQQQDTPRRRRQRVRPTRAEGEQLVAQQPALVQVPQPAGVQYQTAPTQVPQQPTVQAPQQATIKPSEQVTVQAPQTATVQAPQTTTVQAPQTATVQAPQTSTVQVPQTSTVQAPQTATAQAPQTAKVQTMQTATDQTPQMATDKAPEPMMVKAPESVPENAPEPSQVLQAAPEPESESTTINQDAPDGIIATKPVDILDAQPPENDMQSTFEQSGAETVPAVAAKSEVVINTPTVDQEQTEPNQEKLAEAADEAVTNESVVEENIAETMVTEEQATPSELEPVRSKEKQLKSVGNDISHESNLQESSKVVPVSESSPVETVLTEITSESSPEVSAEQPKVKEGELSESSAETVAEVAETNPDANEAATVEVSADRAESEVTLSVSSEVESATTLSVSEDRQGSIEVNEGVETSTTLEIDTNVDDGDRASEDVGESVTLSVSDNVTIDTQNELVLETVEFSADTSTESNVENATEATLSMDIEDTISGANDTEPTKVEEQSSEGKKDSVITDIEKKDDSTADVKNEGVKKDDTKKDAVVSNTGKRVGKLNLAERTPQSKSPHPKAKFVSSQGGVSERLARLQKK